MRDDKREIRADSEESADDAYSLLPQRYLLSTSVFWTAPRRAHNCTEDADGRMGPIFRQRDRPQVYFTPFNPP